MAQHQSQELSPDPKPRLHADVSTITHRWLNHPKRRNHLPGRRPETQTPTFQVASVKPNHSGTHSSDYPSLPGLASGVSSSRITAWLAARTMRTYSQIDYLEAEG